MSLDLSNNYLHNLISDSSNNFQNRFVNLLVNYLNNNSLTSENLIGWSSNNNLQNILNNSLMEEKAYKKVISDKGLESLKEIIYDENKYDTKECVISMDEFKNGDKIIQLPCNHIFHKKPIETWLKEESSKCPICRYQLKFKEIKNKKIDISRNRYNQMFNNMNVIYNPTQYIHRPSTQSLINESSLINTIVDEQNQYLINRNLQNAILSSINTNDYVSSSEEEIDIFEEFDDDTY